MYSLRGATLASRTAPERCWGAGGRVLALRSMPSSSPAWLFSRSSAKMAAWPPQTPKNPTACRSSTSRRYPRAHPAARRSRTRSTLPVWPTDLGYTRYWLAEHHNTPLIASSAPELMIGHVADVTRRIRVGSGGVMLPNQAPLRVAESFRVLEALHPGRVDLGIGRAPGTDPITTLALRRSREAMGADDFPVRLEELLGFLDGEFPGKSPLPTHPRHARRRAHARSLAPRHQ